MKKQYNIFLLMGLVVIAAGIMRLLPHPPNFTPIGALALYGGAMFTRRRYGFLLVSLTMLLSDMILGFHQTMFAVYFSFLCIFLLGSFFHKNPKFSVLLGSSILSSLIFFIVTNFAVWLQLEMYPKTWLGLLQCYTAALPFFRNTFAGDLFYNCVFFACSYAAFFLLKERPIHLMQKVI